VLPPQEASQEIKAWIAGSWQRCETGSFFSLPELNQAIRELLVQQVVEIRSTPTTVEIFHKGNRIASHLRSRRRGQANRPERAPPQESSSPSGMAAIADGELGAQHRFPHGPVVRANHEREAAPGNGLPLPSRHHSPGAAVLPATDGSRGGTGTPRPGLPLSEREVDFEKLARRGSLIFTTTRLPTSPACTLHLVSQLRIVM
jgi:hypothetical protein